MKPQQLNIFSGKHKSDEIIYRLVVKIQSNKKQGIKVISINDELKQMHNE